MFIINKDYTLAEVDQLHRHASQLPGLVDGLEGIDSRERCAQINGL